ncbi:MAG TPA: squalene/phytoene synthase family protein [Allosphingosinicella sp.]|nr:squalene/phytoene synthase family protein [Allosphingosinicella sp.]
MNVLDPDRMLALAYVPASRRAAVEALWRLDATLAAVLSTGREPVISQIRLAWWREALEKLDSAPAPAEPVLAALARHVLPAGLTGAELAEMEAGWAVLLSPDPLGAADFDLYASARGGLLFRSTARLLGEPQPRPAVEAGGRAWALIDLARHSGNAADAEAALSAVGATASWRWPKRLRPLGMLAMLAARDAEPGRPRWELQGAPRRTLRMLRHRLTGK